MLSGYHNVKHLSHHALLRVYIYSSTDSCIETGELRLCSLLLIVAAEVVMVSYIVHLFKQEIQVLREYLTPQTNQFYINYPSRLTLNL